MLVVVLLLVMVVGIFIYKGTYSIVDKDNTSVIENAGEKLILKYDSSDLETDIYNYIDMIDDILIPVSSYTMSDVLSENYDFLVLFAINYILKIAICLIKIFKL